MVSKTGKYRQVRVTLTEQRDVCHPGRSLVAVRVMVKPLHAEWNMRQTIRVEHLHDQVPLATLDDVYHVILDSLGGPVLPGVITPD